MRLSLSEIEKILEIFRKYDRQQFAKVYLFGSRLDSQKKGGDIDLLVVTQDQDLEHLLAQKTLLKYDVQEALGDQRVDITILSQTQSLTDSFAQAVLPTAQILSMNS